MISVTKRKKSAEKKTPKNTKLNKTKSLTSHSGIDGKTKRKQSLKKNHSSSSSESSSSDEDKRARKEEHKRKKEEKKRKAEERVQNEVKNSAVDVRYAELKS